LFVRLSSSYFFYFALLGLILPYLAIYLDGLGFNSRQVGEVLAIVTVTKIIAPSLWAAIADRMAQPLVMFKIGALLSLISFSLLFYSSHYWAIVTCLALFTLFSTAILPQLEVHTLKTLRHSNKLYARVRLWGSIGFILLAVLAGEAMDRFGYQIFISLGIMVLISLFLTTLLLKSRIKPVLAELNQTQLPSITAKLFDVRFVSFFVAGLLLQISFAPYNSFFALFLRDFDYSGLTIGLFIGLGVVAEIVAFIYMGSLFKHCSINTLLVLSLIVSAARWFAMPLIADLPFWLGVSQLSHAVSFAIYHSASMQFISSHFTKRQQGRGQGIYLGGVYGIGGAIGAYVTGVLWLDGKGASDAFIVAGASAFIGAIIMLSVRSKA
jgi:PPP family 3-phenylpropionic acid transporter